MSRPTHWLCCLALVTWTLAACGAAGSSRSGDDTDAPKGGGSATSAHDAPPEIAGDTATEEGAGQAMRAASVVDRAAAAGAHGGTGARTKKDAPLADTGPIDALDEAQRALFLGSRPDPVPDKLHRTVHYVYGNEGYLHLFRDSLADLGGAYVGVGSDQAYVFIGWMKPRLAWLIDYDPWVVNVHRMHLALIEEAESPEAFVDLWRPRDRDDVRALLRERYPDDEAFHAVVSEIQEKYGDYIHRRLRVLRDDMTEAGVPCFVNDQAMYDTVRSLVLRGRVRPMLANLLDDEGVRGIGEVAESLDVPIRAIYLSNAEQYWDYSEEFRANIRSLPTDEHSLVVRTVVSDHDDDVYDYNVQPAAGYKAWLARSTTNDVLDIPRRHLLTVEDERATSSVADARPPEPEDENEDTDAAPGSTDSQ